MDDAMLSLHARSAQALRRGWMRAYEANEPEPRRDPHRPAKHRDLIIALARVLRRDGGFANKLRIAKHIEKYLVDCKLIGKVRMDLVDELPSYDTAYPAIHKVLLRNKREWW